MRLYRDEQSSDHVLVALLAPLALGGYYVDRRLADQYGDEAVQKLAGLLRLPLALKLRRILGRKLSLLLALGTAALSLRLSARKVVAPTFREVIVLLFNCVAALTGVSTICIHPARAKRYANVIEPLTALGKNHVATLMHEYCENLAATVQDRIDYAYQRWTGLLARLESSQPIHGLPDNLRVFYLAGALYARGVMESWRDESRALDYASRLDALNLKLYEMSADQVRMMYFGNQGNMELFERFRERVEMHAIKRGTAWQAETWAAGASITVYLRTHDVHRMRQSEERLRALSREIPSLQSYYDRARGALLLLRGQQSEALPALEKVLGESEQEIVGWGRSHGVLARAYNELGAHRRAREVCEHALSRTTPGDLAFPAMNMILKVEHALASAGLGEPESAAAALDALISEHGQHRGPLTLGALHDARARVAQLQKDEAGVVFHLDQMRHWYRLTGAPSLVERCERLIKQNAPRRPGDSEAPPAGSQESATLVELVRHGGGSSTRSFSAHWSLEKVVGHAGASDGHLYAWSEGSARWCASIGEQLAALDQWAVARLGRGEGGRSVMADATVTDHDEVEFEGRSYRMIALCVPDPAAEYEKRLVGGLVLPADVALSVQAPLLSALAERVEADGMSSTMTKTRV